MRNVKNGLSARTKILSALEQQSFSAGKIVTETALHYNVVMYHLRLLKCEGTVERKGSKRYIWIATGYGQKRLT